MSSMDRQFVPGISASGREGVPLPPVSVLLQLASLVLVLAVEVGKGYLAACITNTKEHFVANPRARNDARGAYSDRN
jgi:hypothetical protein